jgi:hypothetical protein
VLDGAQTTLEQVRRDLAEWARGPSAPMPGAVEAALRDACDEDLGTPEVLALLGRVRADPAVRAGAKFETFVFADRILALDLSARLAGGG